MTITIIVFWNFTNNNGIPDPSAPTIPRPHRPTPRNPMGIYAEPDGNGVSGDSIPTGCTPGAESGEGADDVNINRYGRQPLDEDETPGNPDEETKDASTSASLEWRSFKGQRR